MRSGGASLGGGDISASAGHLRGQTLRATRIRRYGIAVIEALQFSGARFELLESLDEREWQRVLRFCDPAQLTLTLGYCCRSSLPGWVRARIDRNYCDNAKRFAQLEAVLREVADRLQAEHLEFILLKGSTHSGDFTPDPLLRATGDIDLWCLPDYLLHARDQLLALGYRTIAASKGRHLPPMARPSDWQWRGDYFATDLPIPIDLHYSLWDENLEHIPGPPEQDFWRRRVSASLHGRMFQMLALPDALAFAALHLLMHILHGDVRLQRAWEIAHFLHMRASDESFWIEWRELHGSKLRNLQTVVFLLSTEWFGCDFPQVVRDDVQALPPELKLWIERYAFSPIEALFAPNKDELWLNLALVEFLRGKTQVFLRRVLPLHAASIPSCAADPIDAIRFFASRAAHHLRVFPATLFEALKWWWIRQGLSRDFLRFLLSSALFDVGEFIFFLLYNLYLLDRGYQEKFLGQIAGALTAGTFVTIVPAAAIIRRVGPRNGLLIAILGATASTGLRALAVSPAALIISAFLNGLFMSFWAVSLPPVVAGFTTERNRPLAFSLITSLGIGTGVIAGVLGGHLPAILVHIFPLTTPSASKRAALLFGSVIAALAVAPIAPLEFRAAAPVKSDKKLYPRGPFIFRFLSAVFIWNIATGAFNPFFNVYFSRHIHLNVESIGLIFSYAQLTQVGTILLAPLVLRRLGEGPGIAAMQIATAAMLAVLAVNSNPIGAAFLYIGYMSFQYMSEPGMFTMLMNRVNTGEQSGASAMNFLITSLAGILAATSAGAMFARFGYAAILLIAALIAAVAALMFYRLTPGNPEV